MQRDFVGPGGFGASLGNDVTQLHSAIAPIAALLAAWRARRWPVLHTRECHSLPAFKRAALEMITAQGAIIGWCAPSASVLAALPALARLSEATPLS